MHRQSLGQGVPGIPDIQAQRDQRGISINHVGIRGLRLPARVSDTGGRRLATVVEAAAGVALPAHLKGTHMSRFVSVLEATAGDLQLAALEHELTHMLGRLDAEAGALEFAFPWFVEKQAPVSQVRSLLEVAARVVVSREPGQAARVQQAVRVPVTSLCPCSKAISRYGAHNQRSEVRVLLELSDILPLDELVTVVEEQSSCELYGLLKRADEKFVTEKAYENPKFVEDMVRDVYTAVAALPGVHSVEISCENFESIHNHSAYAEIHGEATAF